MIPAIPHIVGEVSLWLFERAGERRIMQITDQLRQAIYRGPRRRFAFRRYLHALERAPWKDPVEICRSC
jgi:hypothetical protein